MYTSPLCVWECPAKLVIEDPEIFTVDGLKSFLRAVNFMLEVVGVPAVAVRNQGLQAIEVAMTGALMASPRPEDPTLTHGLRS